MISFTVLSANNGKIKFSLVFIDRHKTYNFFVAAAAVIVALTKAVVEKKKPALTVKGSLFSVFFFCC